MAIAALALCIPTLLAVPQPAVGAQAGVRLRVVTHNVWTSNVDPEGTARLLASSGADLILLQEVDGDFAPVLRSLQRIYPYATTCRPRCALAILSRYPIEEQRYRFLDGVGQQTGPGMVRTQIRLPHGIGVPIATVHLPRGRSLAADRQQRAGLAEAVRDLDKRGMILAGDFNLVPWSARLRWLDEALQPMRRTTAAMSYPARVGGHAFAMPLVPIDHVYAGANWAFDGAERLARSGSDHYPIAVDLIWQGPNAMVTNAR